MNGKRKSGVCNQCGGMTWDMHTSLCRTCWLTKPGKPGPGALCRARSIAARTKLVDIEWLRVWSRHHGGRSPSLREWNETRPTGAPCRSVYERTYGSWVAAIDAAGLPPRPLDGAGRWASEAAKSKREYHDRNNRQMVTAGTNDVKKWEAVRS